MNKVYLIVILFKTIAILRKLYKSVKDIDLLVGGMSEYVADGLVGPVFKCIIAEQFKRTRQGDRYFYDNAFMSGAFTESKWESLPYVLSCKIQREIDNYCQGYVYVNPTLTWELNKNKFKTETCDFCLCSIKICGFYCKGLCLSII